MGNSCFKDMAHESLKIGKIAAPSMLTNSLEMLMWVTDVIMLGHLGKGHLAAACIGTSYFNISWFFIEGVLTAQDTLSAQAFGMNDLHNVRCWLYVSSAVSCLLCILGTILLGLGYFVIPYVFQVDPHIAFKAAQHVLLIIPNLWFLAGFRVLQKYFLAQNIVMPAVYCSITGNLVNYFLNYFLMFYTGIGFAGVGLSTSIARACMFVQLAYHVVRSDDYIRLKDEATEIYLTAREELSAIFPGSCTISPGGLLSSFASTIDRSKGYKGVQSSDTGEEEVEFGGVGTRRKDNKGLKNAEQSEGDVELGSMSSQRSGEGVIRGRKTATVTDRDVRDGGRREGDGKAVNNSKDNVADEDAIQEEKEKESVILSPLQRGEGSGVGANRRHPIHPSPSHLAPTISMRRPENPNSTIAMKLKSDDTRTSNTSLDTFMDKDNSSENNSAARLLLFRSVRFVLLGLPGGFLLGLDAWIFDIMVVVTAPMGTVILGAQQVLVTLTLFVYLSVPFALGTAVSVRIGQLLGERKPRTACLSARITLFAGFLLMGLCGTAVYYLSPLVGKLFTSDADIQYRVDQLAPVLACFQVAYSVVGCAQGVLRGLGRQAELAGIYFLAIWLIGLPTGMFLVFVARPSFGLEGLWTGLTSGMFFLLIVLLGTIYYVDWEKEVRKTILKNSRLVSGHFVPFGSPLPGSRGVGGLDFMSHRLLEEMEDVDSLELLFDSSVVENEEETLL